MQIPLITPTAKSSHQWIHLNTNRICQPKGTLTTNATLILICYRIPMYQMQTTTVGKSLWRKPNGLWTIIICNTQTTQRWTPQLWIQCNIRGIPFNKVSRIGPHASTRTQSLSHLHLKQRGITYRIFWGIAISVKTIALT